MQEKSLTEQLEIFSQYIREHGLRMTHQRELVVQTFLATEGHPSTDELFELVRRQDRKIGYATVFRTMKALTECGLARETHLNDGRTRYEHLYRHPQHHHIVCMQCNRTIEFFSPELEKLQEKIISEYAFQPMQNRFQILGICKDCQEREQAPREVVDTDLVFARDALKIAMETEKRGVRFYTSASELVTRETTRETFLEMLKDEEKHLSQLQKEWDRLIQRQPDIVDAPVFLHFDFEALQKIFPSRDEVARLLRPDIREEEALRLAMDMEREAWEFFSRYAEKFNDTKGRDIFLQFAREEEDHFNTIKAALDKLSADLGS